MHGGMPTSLEEYYKMRTLLFAAAGLMALATVASAAPVQMSNGQLDQAAAGFSIGSGNGNGNGNVGFGNGNGNGQR